jgi:hypothetical protein
LIALVVVARNSSTSTSTSTSTPAATTSTTPAATTASAAPASPAAASTTKASSAPATSTAATSGHDAPSGIVAHYTAKGATIFWTAPASANVSNYNVEVSTNGGTWKLISTVPSSQLSIDVVKSDTTGWCSFRVSAVYSDGQIIAGKVFGLPGQYN